METELIAIILAIISTLIVAPGPIFLKKASSDIRFDLNVLINKNIWIGFFFYFVGISLSLVALKMSKLSVIGPILGMVYVWVSIISIKYLKEKVNIWKVAGISLVIIGVIMVSI